MATTHSWSFHLKAGPIILFNEALFIIAWQQLIREAFPWKPELLYYLMKRCYHGVAAIHSWSFREKAGFVIRLNANFFVVLRGSNTFAKLSNRKLVKQYVRVRILVVLRGSNMLVSFRKRSKISNSFEYEYFVVLRGSNSLVKLSGERWISILFEYKFFVLLQGSNTFVKLLEGKLV